MNYKNKFFIKNLKVKHTITIALKFIAKNEIINRSFVDTRHFNQIIKKIMWTIILNLTDTSILSIFIFAWERGTPALKFNNCLEKYSKATIKKAILVIKSTLFDDCQI